MPARGEDVGEEGEVGFVVGAGGEGEAVEVGVGDADVLGLLLRFFVNLTSVLCLDSGV